MRTETFEYDLPARLIAQEPRPRGESRLMVLHRTTGETELRRFDELPGFVQPGDVMVVNDTRVIARRLAARSERDRDVEVLLLRRTAPDVWECLAKPSRQLRPGSTCRLDLGEAGWVTVDIIGRTPEGGRALRFSEPHVADLAGVAGEAPLPPYIHSRLNDEERYQTVYASAPGSAAAPTAGLHFTAETLSRCTDAGAKVARVTLHVGVDTFRPVRADEVDDHVMHGEDYCVPGDSAGIINGATGRCVAVGTTVVRALESAADESGAVREGPGRTQMFIRPGYRFRTVDALLTNFHLPRSTLLMMVCSLAGAEPVLAAYRRAVAEEFRFYSFGDAMLIL
ncbi:MAG: tRNA preQ1(34) S-adenosylmethionine ribosyltransferase-isomerase QueA [Armatimonadetes bacterium]|nr:tRNA preQ1(34) S-adenosylmethionine ribosyltransferase-isomerase QueA [Armatimonadota bacterium]